MLQHTPQDNWDNEDRICSEPSAVGASNSEQHVRWIAQQLSCVRLHIVAGHWSALRQTFPSNALPPLLLHFWVLGAFWEHSGVSEKWTFFDKYFLQISNRAFLKNRCMWFIILSNVCFLKRPATPVWVWRRFSQTVIFRSNFSDQISFGDASKSEMPNRPLVSCRLFAV